MGDSDKAIAYLIKNDKLIVDRIAYYEMLANLYKGTQQEKQIECLDELL
jgi:hypothetical protein